MATLRPGPYTLQYPMQYKELTHIFEVNCDIMGDADSGDAPVDILMRTAGSVSNTLEDAANDLWAVVRPFFSSITLCSTYTLWKRSLTVTEREFVSGGTLTSPNGAGGAGGNVDASQAIYTFRSGAGGILKITLLEGLWASNSRIPLPSDVTTGVPAFRAYILSDDNFVMARDRGFPVAAMNASYGQNEKVFNRRFRS